MSTFKKMNVLINKESKWRNSILWGSLVYIFIGIGIFGDVKDNPRNFQQISILIVSVPIYMAALYFSIKKIRIIKKEILGCKAEIESDPVLVAEYHADKNQHDFDEAVQNIRNHIKECYHKIELCERNGQYQMAAKYRGDISTLESKLRQLGC